MFNFDIEIWAKYKGRVNVIGSLEDLNMIKEIIRSLKKK